MRTQDEATDALAPLFDTLFNEVTEGVRDYYRDHPAVNHKHRVSTRRSIMRDYIVYRLRPTLGETKGIQVFNRNQTTYFGINSAWLGRVHMVGKSLIAAVNNTQKSLAFQDNNASVALGPEVAEATCLRIAYSPNARDPMNPGVFIVCPSPSGLSWFIQLARDAGAAIVTIVNPTPPDDLDPIIEVISQPDRESDAG